MGAPGTLRPFRLTNPKGLWANPHPPAATPRVWGKEILKHQGDHWSSCYLRRDTDSRPVVHTRSTNRELRGPPAHFRNSLGITRPTDGSPLGLTTVQT
jgi:hypothetical protein